MLGLKSFELRWLIMLYKIVHNLRHLDRDSLSSSMATRNSHFKMFKPTSPSWAWCAFLCIRSENAWNFSSEVTIAAQCSVRNLVWYINGNNVISIDLKIIFIIDTSIMFQIALYTMTQHYFPSINCNIKMHTLYYVPPPYFRPCSTDDNSTAMNRIQRTNEWLII